MPNPIINIPRAPQAVPTPSRRQKEWMMPDYLTLLSSGSEQDFDRETLVKRARVIDVQGIDFRVEYIDANHPRFALAPVLQLHHDFIGAVDDMVVGQQVALLANNDAGAKRRGVAL